ncbi:GMC family oxidoreductase [Rhodococcus sp. B50]|uniref:GMC family oxidoreductase n=1 Tax=Rhodococcus sp. B50 TaxID=2682847 RepID=UPI001BD5EE06|nr:GMC family oxidoreductase N-terminal domain-containing protein [Rhodococcus sp. B50]
MTQQPSVADYVIVGTGSAGAVLANRLSSDPRKRVVALEAGPEDKNKFVHIPAAFSKLFRSELDWDYLTEPQPALGGRKIYWPRGKMLGGSSSMNAMMWVRGFAADYDEWAELTGDASWSFSGALEYFRRIESVQDDTDPESGHSGPIIVTEQRSPRPLTTAFLDAAAETGFPVERANSSRPEGFSRSMVTQRRGARWSVADAYLRPARGRNNLTVLTGAHATRILLDGTAAVGVEYEKDGARRIIRAQGEVIVAGGAVNTPQLLMLSGIGDEQHLRRHGISVHHHLPEVGQGLTDHFVAGLGYSVDDGSLFSAGTISEFVNYLLRRKGTLTSCVEEAYGFVRSRPDLSVPDLEIFFSPAPFFDQGLVVPTQHTVIIGAILLAPVSRGQITLRSADHTVKPIIDPRYLSDSAGIDRNAMLEGLRLCSVLASAPSLKSRLGPRIRPIPRPGTHDEEMFVHALEELGQTIYHPVGTCRMGRDGTGVVTSRLRVRGIDKLRIADASVMPTTIHGHTHAPTVLIGEKAADLIRHG